ncbi:hypothetical protein KCP69_10060 [Salmonella enterica subsp. enterica]|nr:hypothetical protein KCP69_10060 [Salmonella enterica subsp. enterica]
MPTDSSSGAVASTKLTQLALGAYGGHRANPYARPGGATGSSSGHRAGLRAAAVKLHASRPRYTPLSCMALRA